MLRKAKDLNGYKLSDLDGEIGAVQGFYFDDQSWTVRYLIANTGGWLGKRTVLISPYALEPPKFSEKVIRVDLTKHQIESSSSLAADKWVSRQYEMQYYPFFGWPAYWNGPYVWGPTAYPTRDERSMGYPFRKEAGDPHLRSTHDVTNDRLQRPAEYDVVDECSQGSFPASDPPSWTLGVSDHQPSQESAGGECELHDAH